MQPGFPLPPSNQAPAWNPKHAAAQDNSDDTVAFFGILMANVQNLKPVAMSPAGEQTADPNQAAKDAPQTAQTMVSWSTASSGDPAVSGVPVPSVQTVQTTAASGDPQAGQKHPVPAASTRPQGPVVAAAVDDRGDPRLRNRLLVKGGQFQVPQVDAPEIQVRQEAQGDASSPLLSGGQGTASDVAGSVVTLTAKPPAEMQPQGGRVQFEIGTSAGAAMALKMKNLQMISSGTEPAAPSAAPADPLTVENVLALKARRLLRAMAAEGTREVAYGKPAVPARGTTQGMTPAKNTGPTAVKGESSQPLPPVTEQGAAEVSQPIPDAGSVTAQGKAADVTLEQDLPSQAENAAQASASGAEQAQPAKPTRDPRRQVEMNAARTVQSNPDDHMKSTTVTLAPAGKAGEHSRHDSQSLAIKNGSAQKNHQAVQAPRSHGQVFRQVVANLDPRAGESHVKIQLHPEALGKVEVALVGKGHTLEVHIVADNPQAADALKGSLSDLTSGLKAKAANFHHIEVRVEVREQPVLKADGNQQERREQPRQQGRQNGHDGRGQDHSSKDQPGGRGGKKSRFNPWWQTQKEEA